MEMFMDQEIHLRDYFYILRKRKRLILSVFFTFIFGSIVLTYFSTPLYKASATVLIEKENPNIVDFKEIMALDASNNDYYQTQYEMFKSFSLIKRVSASVKLAEDPYVIKLQKGGIQKLFRKMAFLPPWLQNFFREKTVEEIFIKKMLKVEPIRNTRLVRIGVIHPHSHRSAEIANRLVDLFIDQNLENRFSIATDAVEMISDQLGEMKDRVAEAGRKLQEYKESQGLVNIPSLRVKDQFVQDAKLELVKLQSKESRLAKRYLPAHPKMIHIQSQIEGLQQKINEEEQKQLDLGRKSLDYSELEREEASAKKIYTALLARLQETTSQAKIQSTNIQIVDRAPVPNFLFKPSLFLNLALGIFLGLALGIFCAFFAEYFDATIRVPDDIEKGLGLDLVGIIPHAGTMKEKEGIFTRRDDRNFSAAAEAFRALRTAFLFKLRHFSGCRVILVTSPHPEEGKSTVALNLAAAFQQNHLKVLLIDADLRKPRLHKALQVEREPGLTDSLENARSCKEGIRKNVPELGFDFIPCGTYSNNSTEILGLKSMKNCMQEFRADYDIVIVDSPPFFAVADVHVLCDYADALLIVTRYQKTQKHHLRNLKKRFDTFRDKTLGVVINDVGTKEKDHYYHQYYYYGYGNAPKK